MSKTQESDCLWQRCLTNERETKHLGHLIGSKLVPGDLVAIDGGLGVGKSVLARSAIKAALGSSSQGITIPSPTYTLVNLYEAPEKQIAHIDCYRIATDQELDHLGLPEIFASCICLVEWASRLRNHLPERRLAIDLSEDGETSRKVMIQTLGEGWQHIDSLLKNSDMFSDSKAPED